MKIPMPVAKKRLATVWFIGAGVLFFLFLVQTHSGKYADKTMEAWGWLLPTFMPTLSLIIGVLVSDARSNSPRTGAVDAFLFHLTYSLSSLYLVVVALTILLSPISTTTPLGLMKLSNLGLSPFQGLIAAALGAFFVSETQGGNGTGAKSSEAAAADTQT